MCTKRTWKDFQPIITGNQLTLLATRSDGLIVRTKINFHQDVNEVILMRKVKRAVDDLKSFRDCQCSTVAPCYLHKPLTQEK